MQTNLERHRKPKNWYVGIVDGFKTVIWNLAPAKKYNYDQERARRARQMDKGMLTQANGIDNHLK